jgi:hypothetical protein
MSILQLYTKDEFFTSVKPTEFKSGQFCWIPTPILDKIPRILDIERNLPEEHEEVRFELRLANQSDDFKKRDRSLPIKYLNLRSNEELLAQRAKKRPAIILSSGVECFLNIENLLKSKGKKHHQEGCLFVIPCYNILKETYGPGFIPEQVALIQCLMYRQFFYVPDSLHFTEMIARFDRIHVVIDRSPAAIEPTDLCLSEEVFDLFLAMFLYCISGRTDEELEAVREIVREALPESQKDGS